MPAARRQKAARLRSSVARLVATRGSDAILSAVSRSVLAASIALALVFALGFVCVSVATFCCARLLAPRPAVASPFIAVAERAGVLVSRFSILRPT